MELVKPWWESGGHIRSWMSLTKQRPPQKPPTVSASFAPRLHSTLCECLCGSVSRSVPSRPTPFLKIQLGRPRRSNQNPAQSANLPAMLGTPSLECIRGCREPESFHVRSVWLRPRVRHVTGKKLVRQLLVHRNARLAEMQHLDAPPKQLPHPGVPQVLEGEGLPRLAYAG